MELVVELRCSKCGEELEFEIDTFIKPLNQNQVVTLLVQPCPKCTPLEEEEE